MNKSVFDVIRQGQKFMNLWPKRPELVNYFAEYRAVAVSRLACRYLPSLAFFAFILQVYFAGSDVISQALIYFIFIMSLPIQALLLLGHKAEQQLPPALASWYRDGVNKLKEQKAKNNSNSEQDEQAVELTLTRPSYMDLAQLLNITYRSLS